MFKYRTVGLETIFFSYGQPKDAAALIKSNKFLSRYAGVKFKVGGPMVVRSILPGTEPDFKLPEDPDDTVGKVALLKWETELNVISKKKLIWEDNCQKIFNLYLQHCTADMISQFKLMNGWGRAEVTQDGIALIKMTRSISNQHDGSKHGVMEIVQSDKRIFLTYQTPDLSNTEYLDQFKACVDIIEAYGGTPGAHPGLTKDVLAEMPRLDMSTYPSEVTSDQSKAAKKTARE